MLPNYTNDPCFTAVLHTAFGGAKRDRTADLLLARQALIPTEL